MATSLEILVAEDESLNALALRTQLEALGHRVVGPARDGREAVRLARTTPTVDLAILDIRMPGLSGLGAAEEIMQHRPTPIILLTGHSDPDHFNHLALTPIYHYLVKPISLEDLTPAIAVARSRFEEWQRFQGEAEDLRGKLEDRKLIERAKVVIMEARGLSESGAYRLLQKESQNRNQPMAEIARTVLMTEALLRDAASL
jgi:response regulator NasT